MRVDAVGVLGRQDQDARLGGELIRLAVSRAVPVGGFTAWKPTMPVTQWAVAKQ